MAKTRMLATTEEDQATTLETHLACQGKEILGSVRRLYLNAASSRTTDHCKISEAAHPSVTGLA
jgi:hypothetical protein